MKILGFFVTAALIALPSSLIAAETSPIEAPSSPEARLTLYKAASCLAKASAGEAASLLKMDFRSPTYRTKMDRLLGNNRQCITARWIRSNRLLVAGDLAENLLADSTEQVNVRLAKLPPDVTITPRTPTDAIALCVSRSDHGVAKLFSTTVASTEEAAAATNLGIALNRCNQTGKAVSTSPSGLRAMVATATYRLLEGQES